MTHAGEDLPRRGRRILVTNHHLQVRAGSELVTLELADELRRRGHQVALFTFHPGDLSTAFSAASGIDVLDPGRMEDVRAFDAEVIHAHHWPTLAYLRRFGVEAPAVMGFLGVLPDLENPPPLPTGADIPWWAVSEEVAANVRSVGGWADSRPVVIRNWYDDRSGLPALQPRQPGLQRLLVVSNHFPSELFADLARTAGSFGAEVEHIGLPENPQTIDDPLLRSFDAVITLGRTAITCMANGVPVLILDGGGGDGWVTAESVQHLATCNFSGRARHLEPSSAQLATWLNDRPTADDLGHVREWVHTEALLSKAVDQLEDLYAAAAAEPGRNWLGRWSRVVGDYILERHEMSHELRHLSDEYARARAQRDELAAELAVIREELTGTRGLLEASREEARGLTELRDELLDSLSWRITAPVRAAKRLAVGGRQRASQDP
jgi:hypothetical protein